MENNKVDIAVIKTDVKWIRRKLNREVCPQVAENTKFRQQAKGIIGAVAFVCTAFGGAIMWLIGKLKLWERGT